MENNIINHDAQNQKEDYFTILNCLDIGIYLVEPETYTILAANNSAIKILGRNPVGQRCFEVLLKDQTTPCSHCDNELISRGILQSGSLPWEFKATTNDKWYRCASKIITWPGKRYVKLEIIEDITDSKRVERELNLLRVFKDKIRNLSHLPVMEFDKKGKISYTNVASINLLGYEKKDILDQFIWKYMDDAGKETFFQLIDEVSPKDTECIDCGLVCNDKVVEASLNIVFNRDIKGVLIDGMLFIVQKPKKEFKRYY